MPSNTNNPNLLNNKPNNRANTRARLFGHAPKPAKHNQATLNTNVISSEIKHEENGLSKIDESKQEQVQLSESTTTKIPETTYRSNIEPEESDDDFVVIRHDDASSKEHNTIFKIF